MERKLPSSLGDFIAVIRRRKYWIVVPTTIVIALTLALTPKIPRTYQSTATLMLEPQKVSTAYVRSGSSRNEMANRLQKIEMEVLSGGGFPEIIDKLNLYPKTRHKTAMGHLVAAMRSDITIAPVPDTGGQDGVVAFTISYVGSTPRETQLATNDIAKLFIVENQKEGHQQAEGTEAFLKTQVAQAAQQLAAQQGKIQEFKNAHLGSLPEQAQANMQTIGQYQADLQANSAAIDQDNQQRVYLQSVLNVQPNGDQGEAAPPPATPLQIELVQKETELQADLLKYTPQYPDVIRLKHDIAALKVQIQHQPKSAGAVSLGPVSTTTGPSQTDQLRSQLIALNAEIRTRNARQTQLQQKLQQLQGSVASSSAVQTQFMGLDSDYQEMQKNYNLLVEKQQEAAMASALDQRDDSAQFLVLQPASFPGKPYRPNPMLLDMGGVLIGLFIGLLCGLVVEMRDDTMHDAAEVAEYLKLPVMVALPKMSL